MTLFSFTSKFLVFHPLQNSNTNLFSFFLSPLLFASVSFSARTSKLILLITLPISLLLHSLPQPLTFHDPETRVASGANLPPPPSCRMKIQYRGWKTQTILSVSFKGLLRHGLTLWLYPSLQGSYKIIIRSPTLTESQRVCQGELIIN